jgi:hypothetical protein
MSIATSSARQVVNGPVQNQALAYPGPARSLLLGCRSRLHPVASWVVVCGRARRRRTRRMRPGRRPWRCPSSCRCSRPPSRPPASSSRTPCSGNTRPPASPRSPAGRDHHAGRADSRSRCTASRPRALSPGIAPQDHRRSPAPAGREGAVVSKRVLRLHPVAIAGLHDPPGPVVLNEESGWRLRAAAVRRQRQLAEIRQLAGGWPHGG